MSESLVTARVTLIGIGLVTLALAWALRDLVVLVGGSVVLAYALLPAVRAIERVRDPRGRQLPRGVVAGGLILGLVVVVGWMISIAVPRIGEEASHFATNAPTTIARIAGYLHGYAAAHGLGPWLDPAIDGLRADAQDSLGDLGGTIARGAAGLFGGIGYLLGFALLPLLAFYLLAESDAVRVSALRFAPEGARAEITRLGGAVDRALRSYVRGQAVVCLMTGAAVAIGLALLHHPGALLLGLLAGAAELIPYLGFIVAAAAIALAGSSVGLVQVVLGLVIYIGLNWAIGTFVTPRVMGRYLKLHPFVVTVSVLAGARLLGPAGALLALPLAASLQAVIGAWAPARPQPPRSGPDLAVDRY